MNNEYTTECLIEIFKKWNIVPHIAEMISELDDNIQIHQKKVNSVILKTKVEIMNFNMLLDAAISATLHFKEEEIDNEMESTYEIEYCYENINKNRLLEAFDISINKKIIYIDME